MLTTVTVFFSFSFFSNHMFIVSMVQEMTCIFNDMPKTKPKIKHNNQQKKLTQQVPPTGRVSVVKQP